MQAAQEIWDKQATLKHDHEPLCTTTNCYPSTLLQKCSHDYKSTSMSVKQKRSFSSSSLGCRHGSRISLDTRKVDAECRLYTTNVLFICFFFLNVFCRVMLLKLQFMKYLFLGARDTSPVVVYATFVLSKSSVQSPSLKVFMGTACN